MSNITIINEKLDQKVDGFLVLSDYQPKYILLAQVIRSEMMNLRAGNAHTKTRAEVRGGGKKPWKQKGTGRARHGSTRSPIWVGGGVTFGPRNSRNWHRKINRSSRIAAIKSIIKDRLDSNAIFQFADGFNFPQTKLAIPTLGLIRSEDVKSDKQTVIVYDSSDKEMLNGFTNTEAKMINVNQLRVYVLANSKNLVFTPKAREVLEARIN